jgi:hypothetical protein
MRALRLVPQPPMKRRTRRNSAVAKSALEKESLVGLPFTFYRVYTKAKQTTPLSPVPYRSNVVALYDWSSGTSLIYHFCQTFMSPSPCHHFVNSFQSHPWVRLPISKVFISKSSLGKVAPFQGFHFKNLMIFIGVPT